MQLISGNAPRLDSSQAIMSIAHPVRFARLKAAPSWQSGVPTPSGKCLGADRLHETC
jgi:hypothetical protein